MEANYGVEENIEEGIIRFFQFVSSENFPEITFENAINEIPSYVEFGNFNIRVPEIESKKNTKTNIKAGLMFF